MLISSTGIAIIAIVGSWIAGGILLRTGGLTTVLLGALDLSINHNPAGIALLAIGLALWLVGHWHYALRHHHYKSPLAQRIFQQLIPGRLDPTCGWGIPVMPAEPHSDRRLTPPVPVAANRDGGADRPSTSWLRRP